MPGDVLQRLRARRDFAGGHLRSWLTISGPELCALLDLVDAVARVRRRYAYARDGEIPIRGLDEVWSALARLSGDTGDGGER